MLLYFITLNNSDMIKEAVEARFSLPVVNKASIQMIEDKHKGLIRAINHLKKNPDNMDVYDYEAFARAGIDKLLFPLRKDITANNSKMINDLITHYDLRFRRYGTEYIVYAHNKPDVYLHKFRRGLITLKKEELNHIFKERGHTIDISASYIKWFAHWKDPNHMAWIDISAYY